MKVKTAFRAEPILLGDWIERELDGSDYDLGAVETAKATSENLTEAFSRLVTVLVAKGVLGQKDVSMIVANWANAMEFVE